MRIRLRSKLALTACAAMLCACTPLAATPNDGAQPAAPGPTAVAGVAPTPANTSTPEPTPTTVPTETPVPTPVPTIDATAVVAEVNAGNAQVAERGVDLICLRQEDANDDGAAEEWIGVYSKQSDPPRLGAFVIGGDGAWHELAAVEQGKYGLGEYASCELELRDINADGRTELLVWGHGASSATVLNVFVWNGADYALLAPFESDVSIRLEDRDGDLAEEVVVAYRKTADITWEVVYAWNGTSYAWNWDRYSWFYLDRPHTYVADSPELAVISFYLAIDDRDLPSAYGLLSPGMQGTTSYESFALGYAGTLRAEVGGVREVSRTDETGAVVAAQIRSYDSENGRVIGRLWDVVWILGKSGDGWRLDTSTATQLDQWELTYNR